MERAASSVRPVSRMFNYIDVFLIIHLLAYFVYRAINDSPYILHIEHISLAIYGAVGIILILRDNQYRIFLYIALAVFGFLMGYLLRDSWHYPLSSFIETILYMGTAYMLLRNRHRSLPFKLVYYFVAVYFIYVLVILNSPIRKVLKSGISYNYFSVIIMFSYAIMFLIQYQNKEKIRLIPVLLLLLVAVRAYGRGGILSAIWLLFAYIIAKVLERKRKTTAIIIISAIILAAIVFGSRAFNAVINITQFAKFRNQGLDTPRLDFWRRLFENSTRDLKSFISGGHPDEIFEGGNVHNSFLQMYVALGLFFFIVTMIIVIMRLIRDIRTGNLWMLVIISTIFFRAFTDKTMFSGAFEPVLFYYVFGYIMLKRGRGTEIT